jgi:DNA-binding transcriptional regulator of glucitol operon
MDGKQKSLRERGMKSFKLMMILLAICFVVGPFLFWNQLSHFNATQLTIFSTFHIVGFCGVFCLFLHRYNKYKSMDGKGDQHD